MGFAFWCPAVSARTPRVLGCGAVTLAARKQHVPTSLSSTPENGPRASLEGKCCSLESSCSPVEEELKECSHSTEDGEATCSHTETFQRFIIKEKNRLPNSAAGRILVLKNKVLHATCICVRMHASMRTHTHTHTCTNSYAYADVARALGGRAQAVYHGRLQRARSRVTLI